MGSPVNVDRYKSATIFALWDRTVAFDTLVDSFHYIQQLYRAAVLSGDQLQLEIDHKYRLASLYVDPDLYGPNREDRSRPIGSNRGPIPTY